MVRRHLHGHLTALDDGDKYRPEVEMGVLET
jgi:hypothetical protein